MTAEIVGVRRVDIVNADSNPYHGYSVYVTYPMDNVSGVATERLSLSDTLISGFRPGMIPGVGMTIDYEYNRYGKIGAIRALDYHEASPS